MVDLEPLPHEWMLVSIIGFFISWLHVYPQWSVSWGVTFMIFFVLMFIASVVNMSQSSLHDDHLEELAVHDLHKR